MLYDLDRRHAQSAVETFLNGGRWRLVEERWWRSRAAHDQRAYQGGATGGQGSRQTPWAAEGAQDPSDLATRARGSAANAANAQAFAERLRPVLVELEGLSAYAAAKELDRAVASGRPARLLTFALGSACYEALPHIHP